MKFQELDAIRDRLHKAMPIQHDALMTLLFAVELPDSITLEEIETARTEYARSKSEFEDAFQFCAKRLGDRIAELNHNHP